MHLGPLHSSSSILCLASCFANMQGAQQTFCSVHRNRFGLQFIHPTPHHPSRSSPGSCSVSRKAKRSYFFTMSLAGGVHQRMMPSRFRTHILQSSPKKLTHKTLVPDTPRRPHRQTFSYPIDCFKITLEIKA